MDKEEIYITDLYKKHKGKQLYKGFYSIGKKTYQTNGEVVNEGFVLDREALEVLRAKIMAILINELPKNSRIKLGPKKFKETKLF